MISATNSNSLVHKMKFEKNSSIFTPPTVESTISDEIHEAYLRRNEHCNPSNDAIGVISATNSNSLMHKMKMVKRFDFHHTKAHSQSTISDEIHEAYLRRNEHAILAMLIPV